MTVREALRRGTATLPTRRGLPDPRREAFFLLGAAWGVDEIWLRVHPDTALPPEVDRRYREFIDRREKGEPAEYITGRCSFWGRTFRVNPSVLIPRPETELLIDMALAAPLPDRARVADIGTGSGCIAVTLAADRPRWRVTGLDRSLAALATARANGRDHRVSVSWSASDLGLAVAGGFDLVVANLPYIPTAWLPDLGPELAREPRNALDGGEDGLDFILPLIRDLDRLLSPRGIGLLEVAEGHAAALSDRVVPFGFEVLERRRDVSGCDRAVLLERRPAPSGC